MRFYEGFFLRGFVSHWFLNMHKKLPCLELEFLNNLWGLEKPSKDRVAVPARQSPYL
jgi:hypothetical protein